MRMSIRAASLGFLIFWSVLLHGFSNNSLHSLLLELKSLLQYIHEGAIFLGFLQYFSAIVGAVFCTSALWLHLMLIKANYHRGKRPTEKGQKAHWAYCPKPKWAFCPRETCHTFCSVASSPCIAFLHQVAQIHFKAICFMLGMVFHGHQILTCLRHQLLSSKNYKKMVKNINIHLQQKILPTTPWILVTSQKQLLPSVWFLKNVAIYHKVAAKASGPFAPGGLLAPCYSTSTVTSQIDVCLFSHFKGKRAKMQRRP